MAFFQVLDVTKKYNGKTIIQNISIDIAKGEIVSLLGESGVGKTTLFNVMSGLEIPDHGHIYLNDDEITGVSGKISYMQQKDLLLPFLKVIDNVSLPLRFKGIGKATARNDVKPYFLEFGLGGAENLYPHELSGGMKQRASFLRSYLYSKDMMLLDEPFSALDSITKTNMLQWYRGVAKKYKTTAFLITHDIAEAIFLSDKIYIMAGKPASISTEFTIDYNEVRDDNFVLSNDFLKYQRLIKDFLRKISLTKLEGEGLVRDILCKSLPHSKGEK